MTVFADSSAIVKLYVPEAGHELVRRTPHPLVISALARVEVPAAFWGKRRTGEIAPADAALLSTAFEFDFHGGDGREPMFVVVPLVETILVNAARQAARHDLRAYDATQLATAIAARRADESIDTVAVFDRDLAAAAYAEGFTVLG